MRLVIRYRDGEGTIPEREISEAVPIDDNSIEAYCHLRCDRRSFRLDNIAHAVVPETGEVVPNLWKLFGMVETQAGQPNPKALIGLALPAVRALKHLTKRIRRFGVREREHIVQFIARHGSIAALTAAQLDEWLIALWPGDDEEYRFDLQLIPPSLLGDCHATAMHIAQGSGRRRVDPEVAERINTDFGPTRGRQVAQQPAAAGREA
jgi:hypothetical protein